MSADRQGLDRQKRDPDAPIGSTEFAIIACALSEIPMVANEVARAVLQRCRS
jgi:hypothetical protein